MGNAHSKFDIMSNLPPEIVLQILGFLDETSVQRCLLVCRTWQQVIAHLDPYWNDRAVAALGLTRETVRLYRPRFPTARLFYMAARRRTLMIQRNNYNFINVDYESVFGGSTVIQCLQTKGGLVVHTVRTNEDMWGVDDSYYSQTKIMVHKIESGLVSELYCVPVGPWSVDLVWAYATASHLYWVSQCGAWRSYLVDQEGTVELDFQWRQPLVNDGEGVSMSCCNKCQLVAAVHWGQTRQEQTSCTLQLTQLQDFTDRNNVEHTPPSTAHIALRHRHNVYINHDPRQWLREVLVLPTSKETVEGRCLSHKLVLQCDCCAVMVTFHYPGPVFTSQCCIHCSSNLTYSHPDILTAIRETSSEVCLSADQSLLGMVFDNSIVVHQISDLESTPNLFSRAPLHQRPAVLCNGVKTVAVGKIYSLVCYENKVCLMDYQVHIVLNQTGQTLSKLVRTENLRRQHIDDPLHRLYLLAQDEEWLNDLHSDLPLVPMIAIHNTHGCMIVESTGAKRTRSPHQWRQHWTRAINYTFRN